MPHLSVFGPHLSRPGISDLLVQADVQVVAGFISEEEADGDLLSRWSQSDVNFQLSLQDTQLPQTAAITHHHGAHGFFNLKFRESKLINNTVGCVEEVCDCDEYLQQPSMGP